MLPVDLLDRSEGEMEESVRRDVEKIGEVRDDLITAFYVLCPGT